MPAPEHLTVIDLLAPCDFAAKMKKIFAGHSDISGAHLVTIMLTGKGGRARVVKLRCQCEFAAADAAHRLGATTCSAMIVELRRRLEEECTVEIPYGTRLPPMCSAMQTSWNAQKETWYSAVLNARKKRATRKMDESLTLSTEKLLDQLVYVHLQKIWGVLPIRLSVIGNTIHFVVGLSKSWAWYDWNESRGWRMYRRAAYVSSGPGALKALNEIKPETLCAIVRYENVLNRKLSYAS